MPLSPATTTADAISTESHLCQARLILEFQDLCDHSNLSLVHLQTLTTELKLLRRENADLKVANSELVKLVSLAFQASVWGKLLGANIQDAASAELFEPEQLARQIIAKSTIVKKIGFIGLGAMGFGMATHLLKSNFCVVGYDVNPHFFFFLFCERVSSCLELCKD
ncbi:hypothetical protein DKX38_022052 [Salix brachista]|uniref:6-phosphogluconate dehydrogenase NADP-binding domain-containing protein n=1 Tax=Salix brachista TaxID=2182728 RepID=A0A5N5K3B8_9ROSI|nr:hypothetical protein DKX38_022052 [Salix brachista]